MKKIILAAFICIQFLAGKAFAQSGDLEVVGIDAEALRVSINQPFDLILTVNQNGPQDLPVSSARVSVSINTAYLNWVLPLTVTDDCGGVWSVQGTPTATSSQIQIRNNNAPLVNGAACSIRIPVIGMAVGTTRFNVTSTVLGSGASDPNGTNQGGAGEVALPVKLTKFTAQRESKIVVLQWETTIEANSDRFEIERSLNGESWNRIGSVASHQESNTLKKYSFSDKSPESGENLYRLKSVDKDSKFAYSGIRSVMMDRVKKDLSVYPNPSSDFVRLREPQNVASVSIMDMNGKTVYSTASISKGDISVKNLAVGMYTVRIVTKDGGESVQKLVVTR